MLEKLRPAGPAEQAAMLRAYARRLVSEAQLEAGVELTGIA